MWCWCPWVCWYCVCLPVVLLLPFAPAASVVCCSRRHFAPGVAFGVYPMCHTPVLALRFGGSWSLSTEPRVAQWVAGRAGLTRWSDSRADPGERSTAAVCVFHTYSVPKHHEMLHPGMHSPSVPANHSMTSPFTFLPIYLHCLLSSGCPESLG